MAEYRTLKMSFWSDPFVEELTAPQKLLYLYLITSEHTNNLGIVYVSLRKIAFETGLDASAIDASITALEERGKVIRDGYYILLRKFIKNQCALGEKVRTGLQSLFADVSSKLLRQCLIKEYQFLAPGEDAFPDSDESEKYPMDTVSETDEYPLNTLSIPPEEQEQEQEEKDRSSSLPLPRKDPNPERFDGKKIKLLWPTGDEQDSLPPEDGQYPSGIPVCPHKAIIAAYHELLPELPGVRIWRSNKAVELKARWIEKFREGKFQDTETGVAYFRRFFEYVGTRDFLMGRVKNWRADLGWLVKAANFDKVISGAYRNDGEKEAA